MQNKNRYVLWCGCVLVYVSDKPVCWVACDTPKDCELSFDERADLVPVRKETEE